jgi:hypothetical protein
MLILSCSGFVILSACEESRYPACEILRFTQDDKGQGESDKGQGESDKVELYGKVGLNDKMRPSKTLRNDFVWRNLTRRVFFALPKWTDCPSLDQSHPTSYYHQGFLE